MIRSTICVLAASAIGLAAAAPCHLYEPNLETPCFTQLKNTSAYEVRSYADSSPEFWTMATIHSDSFAVAQSEGFHQNFDYISGQNSKSQKIPMTAPVINRNNGSDWLVSFFVPSSFQSYSDVPKSDVVQIITASKLKFAVTVFPGFADQSKYEAHEAQLKASLSKAGEKIISDEWGVVWAAYDSPFTLFNRHNEVWVHIA